MPRPYKGATALDEASARFDNFRVDGGILILGDGPFSGLVPPLTAPGEYGLLVASDTGLCVVDDGGALMPYLGDTLLSPNASGLVASGLAGWYRSYVATISTVDNFVVTDNSAVPLPITVQNRGFAPAVMVQGGSNGGWIEALRSDSHQIVAGDDLGSIGFGGSDGGATRLDRARVLAEGDGTWTGNADTPSRITILTCPDGSGTPVQGLLVAAGGHMYDRDNRRLIGRQTTAPSPYYLEAIPRWSCIAVSSLVTGTVYSQALLLEAGDVVTNLAWRSIGAAATLTHQIAGLYDSSFNRVAMSSDATSAAWGANTTKSFAMSSPYTVPTTGYYYASLRVSATTMPTLAGYNGNTAFMSTSQAWSFSSDVDTAATTVPTALGSRTGFASFWAGVS